MKLETKRKLKSEVCWAYTRTGAFQRSRIYTNKATDDLDKIAFRNKVKDFLYHEIFIKYWKKRISENKLLEIIDKLIKHTKGSRCLEKGRLQFGNAQKFVNLYLKAMWIAGWGKVPPHFPVDRIIMQELRLKYSWTNMGKTQYKNVIEKAKKVKNSSREYPSLAIMEASIYQIKYLDSVLA